MLITSSMKVKEENELLDGDIVQVLTQTDWHTGRSNDSAGSHNS